MDYEQLLKQACKAVDDVTDGNIFEVKQLFPGYKWETLSRGERSMFGRYFSNAVKDGRVPAVTQYKEGKNHHNRYLKKGR